MKKRIALTLVTLLLISGCASKEEAKSELAPPVITVIDKTLDVEIKEPKEESKEESSKPSPEPSKESFAPSVEPSTEVSVEPSTETPEEPKEVAPVGEVELVFNLVNNERMAAGLKPLTFDSTLCQVAEIRAKEIPHKWSHERKDGSYFYHILKEWSYDYYHAGENLGRAYQIETVVSMWKDSPGHYKNIVDDFTRTGIAVYDFVGLKFVVQIFANRKGEI